jgi:FkbM family methyltransferase
MIQGESWRRRLVRAIAPRRGYVSRRLLRMAEFYVAAARNHDQDMRTNGECWLLRGLASAQVRVVFDVGANRGEWSEQVTLALPRATIHAFEIVPTTASILAELAARQPAIHANGFGLAELAGTLRVNVSPANDKVASLLPTHTLPIASHRTLMWEAADAAVRRGDEYCLANGIERIDVLKIDVVGAENRVIDGFGTMIDDGRIGLIQFEYGLAAAHSRYLLADHYANLGPRGYRIGKLMPSWIEFKDYELTDETFTWANYVAVHASRTDLLGALLN